MENIIDKFRLKTEKEDYNALETSINNGVVFRGTNLWILIFAIFVASLGLNVNSPAVIIGAMLISPLMGPIIGLGFGMAINDLPLLRKAWLNYIVAAVVGLITSTIYFLLSPINDAHSELLARTSPNIYDVLIALFGGLAGVLATSSKQKGNVIQGVAIATALMPPLCTAGYGLATFQFKFFFGAFYLFIINTVFIALAAFVTIRLLKFPVKHQLNPKDEIKARRIVGVIVIITLLPSIYFGYDIVQKNEYSKNASRFIETEAIFPNDYLLKKVVDAGQKTIILTYGGEKITEDKISELKSKLKDYHLDDTDLQIRQGFSYLVEDNEKNEQLNQLSMVLESKDKELRLIKSSNDSIKADTVYRVQLTKEMKALYPNTRSVSIAPIYDLEQMENKKYQLVYIEFSKKPDNKIKQQMNNWLTAKLGENIKIVMENN